MTKDEIIASQTEKIRKLIKRNRELEAYLIRNGGGAFVRGSETCVSCGYPVPEGRQVCPVCEDLGGVKNDD